jgi:hypothetical protein
MGSIFRNFVLAPAVIAAAALATNTAMAETTVKVPFSFTVAGKNCPAGLYSIQWESTHGNLVTLKSKEVPQSFTWVVGPGDPTPGDTAVVLRFDELGEMHALRSVQYGSQITSRLDKKANQAEHVKTQHIRTLIVSGQ